MRAAAWMVANRTTASNLCAASGWEVTRSRMT
jgi:hypothetical protein